MSIYCQYLEGRESIFIHSLTLEHLECGHQPHAQDRGAEKRTQLAGRSASGYGQESPSPGVKKKENGQPKGGMGGRHAATTQEYLF